MPLYFFHSQDGDVVIDPDGTECADYSAAKVEAVRLMGGLIAEQPEDFWGSESMKLMVTNESGMLLFALDLSCVEAPRLGTPAGPPPVA